MQNINYAFLLSRPVWGAWIEMVVVSMAMPSRGSRAPYGARGLKFAGRLNGNGAVGRAPYGARGLKFFELPWAARLGAVAPRMGRVD